MGAEHAPPHYNIFIILRHSLTKHHRIRTRLFHEEIMFFCCHNAILIRRYRSKCNDCLYGV